MIRMPAFTVAGSDGTVNVCAAAPPLDQPVNCHACPDASVCCAGASIVCISPMPHVNAYDGQFVRPSIFKLNCCGMVSRTTATPGTYVAVSCTGFEPPGTVSACVAAPPSL